MIRMKTIILDGEAVEVMICPPSRRKAASSIQRLNPRRRSSEAARKIAALWIARDLGKKGVS